MLVRESLINQIINHFSILKEQVKIRSKVNLQDINVHSEQLYKILLNDIFGYNLENINEEFQNHIVNEKLKTLITQHKKVKEKIKILDNDRSNILTIIDKEEVFKNLKQNLAFYPKKSEESSNIRTQLKRYDSNNKRKNVLKANKSTLVTKIDEIIFENENIIQNSIKEVDSFQYILTLNSDKLDDIESEKFLDFNLHNYARAILTKSNRFIFGNKYSEK